MTLKMKLLALSMLLFVVAASLFAVPTSLFAAPSDADNRDRVAKILAHTPLIDGHNDLRWEIQERFKGRLSTFDLKSDTSKLPAPAGEAALMTDLPRLRRVGRGAILVASAWPRSCAARGRRPKRSSMRERTSHSTTTVPTMRGWMVHTYW